MIRYFFHTENGRSWFDAEGMAFGDLAAAKLEAVRLMGDLLRDNAHDFWNDGTLRLTVTDQGGQIAFVLDLKATEAPVPEVRDR